MTTQTDQGPTTDPCGDCDHGGIEDLSCSAKRFQKQAEVANQSATELEGYRAQFATARADYTKVRDAVKADVDAASTQLKHVHDTLRCLLDDDEKHCLKESLCTVVEAIDECAGASGCCVGDCEFDSSVGEGETASDLAGRIDKYRRSTQQNTDCFTSLIAQQQQIPTDVAAIKAEVTQLAADVAAEGDKDVIRLYSRWLVARMKLEPKRLWRGLLTVNDYVDCLCRALRCALLGWEAIIVLEGAKAEMDCKDQAKVAACLKKQQDILEDLLCEYEKCRPQHGGSTGSSGGSDGGSGGAPSTPAGAPGGDHSDDDDECNCGHHHHHHHDGDHDHEHDDGDYTGA